MRIGDRESGIRSGGSFNWFFQRVSGAFLLLALLAHFWVLHFFSPEHGSITYETVMQRLQHPIWRTVDLLFLLFGLYHGMNGIMMIIHDYLHRTVPRMILVGALWVAVLFLMVIGSMTILGLAGGHS